MKTYSINELTTASGKARVTLTKRLADAPRGEDGKIALAEVLDAFERFGAGNAGKLSLQEENARLARERRLALEAARAEREGTIQGSITLAECNRAAEEIGWVLMVTAGSFLDGSVHEWCEHEEKFNEATDKAEQALHYAIGSMMGAVGERIPEPMKKGLLKGLSNPSTWRPEQYEEWANGLCDFLLNLEKDEKREKSTN
jgi:hypothetical protein